MNTDDLARRVLARLQGQMTDDQRAFCDATGATVNPLGLVILPTAPPAEVDIAALFGWQTGGLVVVLGEDDE